MATPISALTQTGTTLLGVSTANPPSGGLEERTSNVAAVALRDQSTTATVGLLRNTSDDETLLTPEEAEWLTRVREYGTALCNAPLHIQDNCKIVLEAVKQNGVAFAWASERLRDDKTIVLETVKRDIWAFPHASERLRNDETIVLAAIKHDGWALRYASERLRNDETIVLEAVKQDGSVLEFASERLRNDETIVLEAVVMHEYAIQFAGKSLTDSLDFLLHLHTALGSKKTLALLYRKNMVYEAAILREELKRRVMAAFFCSFTQDVALAIQLVNLVGV